MKEPTHFPKPEYDRCNAGHHLVEMYDEKRNRFDWDCPICKRKMEEARKKKKEVRRSMATEVALSDTLDIDSETEIWS